jgi:hypothetical protein
MAKEERKMAHEIALFLKFVNESRLPIENQLSRYTAMGRVNLTSYVIIKVKA